MSIDPTTLMPLAQWQRFRREHARQLAAHRRRRAVPLGPHMRLQFEDEWTVRWHVQEVLRIEQITRSEEVRAEVERYAHLCPRGGAEWIATLMIEIPDPGLRSVRLPQLTQAAHEVFVQVDGAPHRRVFARANDDLPDRHRARASAVHFLRFCWPPQARAALLGGRGAWLGCTHPHYAFTRLLPPAAMGALRADLAPPARVLPRLQVPGPAFEPTLSPPHPCKESA